MMMTSPLIPFRKKKATANVLKNLQLLNVVSTFIYMTNYYVVAPMSRLYMAHLGSTEALSSIIIDMTPWAALVSSIVYNMYLPVMKGHQHMLPLSLMGH
eukprot:5343298-Ditylum_brightwellii.AAC.1